jgi:hypothetical protein
MEPSANLFFCILDSDDNKEATAPHGRFRLYKQTAEALILNMQLFNEALHLSSIVKIKESESSGQTL